MSAIEKHESKAIDIYRKYQLQTSIDGGGCNDTETTAVLQRSLTKKKINIPICDVHNDSEYDANVMPNFVLPSSYVKHNKKIGDEVDVSIDYVVDTADKLWIAAQIKSEGGKDISKLFTYSAFETILNILEQYTGFSKDPIPLIHAEKLIGEKLNWASAAHALVTNVIREVYQYWMRKRESTGKPLCRKYWPQTSSTDSNPHQVFRTRDKEKYRLRKQQKRNDVEAFRKMQHLRKDFSKAKVLMELILERETLREAEYAVQREIFEQQLHDLGPATQPLSSSTSKVADSSGAVGQDEVRGGHEMVADKLGDEGSSSSSKRRHAVPFRHSLLFTHIDKMPEVTSIFGGSSSSSSGKTHHGHQHSAAVAVAQHHHVSLSASSNDDDQDLDYASAAAVKRSSTAPSSSSATAAATASSGAGGTALKKSSSLVDLSVVASSSSKKGAAAGSASESKRVTAASAEEKKKGAAPAAASSSTDKKKKQKAAAGADSSRMVMYTVANGQTVELGTGAIIPTTGSSATTNGTSGTNAATVTVTGSAGHHADVLTVNGHGANGGAASTGTGDEEMRLIHPNLDGPASLCQPPWPFFMAPLPTREDPPTASHKSYGDYLDGLELRRDEATGQIVPPEKYRCRCRVGRGGRLIMDRIPVYSSPAPTGGDENWSSGAHDDATSSFPSSSYESGTYYYPTSARYQQFTAMFASQQSAAKVLVAPPPVVAAVNALGVSDAASASPNNGHAPPPQGGMPVTRQLPEVPLSNLKIMKYNVRVKNSNLQAAQNAAAAGVGGHIPPPQQQRIPTDLPAFMPPARLPLSGGVRQRLADICGESDSEDERVVVPRARTGCAELERSSITKASLAAAAAAVNGDSSGNGCAGGGGSSGTNSNVKFAVRI